MNNYSHAPNGRIWLCWNQNVWNYTLLESSAQQISIKATNAGSLQLYLTIVYGSNWQRETEQLWSLLIQINQHFIDGPWSVMGDFNTARFCYEKIGGKPLAFAKLTPFNNCINAYELSDLKHIGHFGPGTTILIALPE